MPMADKLIVDCSKPVGEQERRVAPTTAERTAFAAAETAAVAAETAEATKWAERTAAIAALKASSDPQIQNIVKVLGL